MRANHDTARIEQNQSRFVEALRSNNFETLGALHSKQAVLLPPAHRIVAGPEAIVAYWKNNERIEDLALTIISAQRLCNFGFRASGNLVLSMRTSHRGSFYQPAKFVATWVRELDNWKIDALAWNAINL